MWRQFHSAFIPQIIQDAVQLFVDGIGSNYYLLIRISLASATIPLLWISRDGQARKRLEVDRQSVGSITRDDGRGVINNG